MATSDIIARGSTGATHRQPARGGSRTWLNRGIFIGALAPLATIIWRGSQGTLSADPIAAAENELGLTALVLLVASLACSPAQRLMGWTWPVRVRRLLGLYAFFYASLHFLLYLAFDQGFNLALIWEDIAKRPFITVGFAAFVILIPLALTSTRDSVRRLGFKRWQKLHMLAYAAGILAVLHFIWRVKVDLSQPLLYAWILGLLLLARLMLNVLNRYRKSKAASGS